MYIYYIILYYIILYYIILYYIILYYIILYYIILYIYICIYICIYIYSISQSIQWQRIHDAVYSRRLASSNSYNLQRKKYADRSSTRQASPPAHANGPSNKHGWHLVFKVFKIFKLVDTVWRCFKSFVQFCLIRWGFHTLTLQSITVRKKLNNSASVPKKSESKLRRSILPIKLFINSLYNSSIHLPTWLLPAFVNLYLPVYISFCPSIHLPYRPTCPPYPSTHLPVYHCIPYTYHYLSICLPTS